jgi:hypothetical protein
MARTRTIIAGNEAARLHRALHDTTVDTLDGRRRLLEWERRPSRMREREIHA